MSAERRITTPPLAGSLPPLGLSASSAVEPALLPSQRCGGRPQAGRQNATNTKSINKVQMLIFCQLNIGKPNKIATISDQLPNACVPIGPCDACCLHTVQQTTHDAQNVNLTKQLQTWIRTKPVCSLHARPSELAIPRPA